jgi:hypothetical protein
MNGQQSPQKPSGGTAPPIRHRPPDRAALDNLIRRRLRVSDPADAEEVATALVRLFPGEREALAREAAGLPFLALPVSLAAPAPATASTAEVEQATTDVERDLTTLTTNSLLKDIAPELRGWASAIRNAVSDGLGAARQALDPRQRDRAFAARRLLGDYARIVRFVGALTPNLNVYYRRLAQSLDEAAGMMLVVMGEALANIGFSGRFLLQVPASELQERRDAVIYALRNLIGSTQEAYGPNDWPRGLLAYRQFLHRLEQAGQADLQSLFQEATIARLMDDLVDRAAGGTPEGLRALGATAQLAVESFRRLILMGQRVVSPESPPLAAFLGALQLFLDAFDPTHAGSGARLLYLSRPPIVFYGLYGIGGPDEATRRLLALVQVRGVLAERLDCYLGCDCSPSRVRCQILLDKVLYDLDRAIDLYALGTDPEGEGEPEIRAAAYGFVIDELIAWADADAPLEQRLCCFDPPQGCGPADRSGERLRRTLRDAQHELWWHDHHFDLFTPVTAELPEEDVPHPRLLFADADGNHFEIPGFEDVTFEHLGARVRDVSRALAAVQAAHPDADLTLPGGLRAVRRIVQRMHQELCLQRDAELQWESLLHTMAPSCVRFNGVLTPVTELIERAIRAVRATPEAACPEFRINIPPHFETSLDSLADDVDRMGGGRPDEESLEP